MYPLLSSRTEHPVPRAPRTPLWPHLFLLYRYTIPQLNTYPLALKHMMLYNLNDFFVSYILNFINRINTGVKGADPTHSRKSMFNF